MKVEINAHGNSSRGRTTWAVGITPTAKLVKIKGKTSSLVLRGQSRFGVTNDVTYTAEIELDSADLRNIFKTLIADKDESLDWLRQNL
jgi:hypothetical protein